MAETHRFLFERICSFQNLLLAARRAQKGKRLKPATARFNYGLEGELLALRKELREGAYRPGPYRLFTVFESKKRLISAAPYRDRVVHHALINVIGPIFERSFIFDSYANRKGKGTHKALSRLSAFCRGARYALKCDVEKYFDSIDRRKLLGLLARRIRDEPTLRLIALILGLPPDGAAAKGIPIGNLTSQFFANVYLDGFDHFVKETLRCRRYLRYVDDFVLLHDDKRRLHEARSAVEAQLAGLGLRLPVDQTQVFPVAQGVDFLGFKVFPTHRLLRRSSLRHFRGRLKAMQSERRAGRLSWKGILRSIRGWIAHVSWGDTWGLRAKLLGESTFSSDE